MRKGAKSCIEGELDTNHNPDGTFYDKGNFDRTNAFIPKEQIM